MTELLFSRWAFFLIHMMVPFSLGVALNTTVQEKLLKDQNQNWPSPNHLRLAPNILYSRTPLINLNFICIALSS